METSQSSKSIYPTAKYCMSFEHYLTCGVRLPIKAKNKLIKYAKEQGAIFGVPYTHKAFYVYTDDMFVPVCFGVTFDELPNKGRVLDSRFEDRDTMLGYSALKSVN
jgi:hypothetical protein